jgi:hypothetical protein
MFIRPDLDLTLGGATALLTEAEEGAEPKRVSPDDIRIVIDAPDPTFVFGDDEIPLTKDGLQMIGDLIQVPSAFLKRMDTQVSKSTQETLLNEILGNALQKDARIVAGTGGLISIAEWGRDPIKPKDILRVATNVLGDDAPIARWVNTPQEFSFDVYAPEGFEHGYGGDGVTPYADGNVMDDITAGGLRFGVNLKQGLAPYTQEWLFRLACTNGYEVARDGLKVDARGQTGDEILAELEQMAQIAMGRVEEDIRHFYDLKQQRVDNPERAIRTIAREHRIPDRSTMALIDLAATHDLPDEPTMFDIVNLITNFANNPSIKNDGGRRLLEGAGGATVTEHAARCGHCQQKVH